MGERRYPFRQLQRRAREAHGRARRRLRDCACRVCTSDLTPRGRCPRCRSELSHAPLRHDISGAPKCRSTPTVPTLLHLMSYIAAYTCCAGNGAAPSSRARHAARSGRSRLAQNAPPLRACARRAAEGLRGAGGSQAAWGLPPTRPRAPSPSLLAVTLGPLEAVTLGPRHARLSPLPSVAVPGGLGACRQHLINGRQVGCGGVRGWVGGRAGG